MKTKHFGLLILGLAMVNLIASCKKENSNGTVEGQGFKANTEQSDSNGRSHLDGTAVQWTAGDRIMVANGVGATLAFTLKDGANSTEGTFYSTGDNADFFEPSYVAAYPASYVSGINGSDVIFDIPAVQTYKANTFGEGAMPMVASSEEQTFEFKNVMGGLCIPLVGNVTVTRIVVTSNVEEALWGTCTTTVSAIPASTMENESEDRNAVTLDCGRGVVLNATTATDFYVMVPVGSLASGFKVTIYNGNMKLDEKTTSANPNIIRSVISKTAESLQVEVTPSDPLFMPLTFEAKADNSTVTFTAAELPTAIALEYSTNGENWTAYTSGTTITLANMGDKVYFRGENATLGTIIFSRDDGEDDEYRLSNFSCTGECYVYGNVMSLLDAENFASATTLNDFAFMGLFAGFEDVNPIFSHEDKALVLPATTLADYCYYGMFINCAGLTTPPVLSATTLGKYCYSYMFYCCTNLATAPELPAAALAESCYEIMFAGCSSLTTPPALHATTLAESCYESMFAGCSNLRTVPELPATTLAKFCYAGMFHECIGLTTVPLEYLPATTLAEACYLDMFGGCTSLTTAPELPATTLAENCYEEMFSRCTSLTAAPELRATTLAGRCYREMFEYCIGLTSAPELCASTLVYHCYMGMFRGCINLSYIKCLATDISAERCTDFWVNNVAATGTFVKAASMEDWGAAAVGDGIPSGWTVVDAD